MSEVVSSTMMAMMAVRNEFHNAYEDLLERLLLCWYSTCRMIALSCLVFALVYVPWTAVGLLPGMVKHVCHEHGEESIGTAAARAACSVVGVLSFVVVCG